MTINHGAFMAIPVSRAPPQRNQVVRRGGRAITTSPDQRAAQSSTVDS